MVPTLLSGSEGWTLYRHKIRALERFHQQKLWAILDVHLQDKVSNSEIRARNMSGVEALETPSQLGHARRIMELKQQPPE